MPLPGDGRSGTFSATVSPYGGYRAAPDHATGTYPTGPSQIYKAPPGGPSDTYGALVFADAPVWWARGNGSAVDERGYTPGTLVNGVVYSPPDVVDGTAYMADGFSTQDTSKWFFDTGAVVTGGQLTLAVNSSYTATANSLNSYDLTGAAAYVTVAQRPNLGNGTTEMIFALGITGGGGADRVMWYITGSSLVAYRKVAGVTTSVASMTYNATTHQRLRIRESGGSVFWDTWDGTSWTQRGSWVHTFAVTTMTVVLNAGYYGTEPSPGTAIFDDFNISPSTTTAMVPYSGPAATFNVDGVNDYVSFPNSLAINLTNEFTFEAWVNADTLASFGSVISKNGVYGIHHNGTQIGLFVTGGGQANIRLYSPTAISTGTTYHVAGVLGGGFARLYVNGAEVANTAFVSAPSDTGALLLGAVTTTTEFWDGRIAEAAIYNRALTGTDISNHYYTGSGATPPGSATATGAVTLDGGATANAGASANGTVTLGGAPAATAQLSSAGVVGLGGAGAATVKPTAAGTVTLGGAATAAGALPASASGSVTLGGSGSARVSALATGTAVLAGSATARAPTSATGGVSLGGSATAGAPVSTMGSVTLGGSSAAGASVAAAGGITLGGAAAYTRPKIATLTDTFTTQDNTKWIYGLRASVVDGRLSSEPDPAYNGNIWSVGYDLTNSEALVEIVQAPSGPGYTDTYMVLANDSAPSGRRGFSVDVENTSIAAYFYDAGGFTAVGGAVYSPINHRWVRIRHAGSTVFYEASPDAQAWTVLASLTPPWPIDDMVVGLGCGGDDPSSPPQALLDNFNVPAGANPSHGPGTSTIDFEAGTAVLSSGEVGTATLTSEPAYGFGTGPFGSGPFGGAETTEPATASIDVLDRGTVTLASVTPSTATLAGNGTGTAQLEPSTKTATLQLT